jgi:uncharacterized protein YhaN
MDDVRAKWLEVALARILLGEAKDRFQDQVQGGVFERASGYIHMLTDGESESIKMEGDTYVLVDRDGRTRTIAQLNRSHAERVLLAVRLAYVDHYCDAREPLPIILDDVLVNFDPKRQELAVRTIMEVASRHQVVYLTCHPSARAVFEAAGARFQHVRLDQWRFVAPKGVSVGRSPLEA